MTSRRVVNEPTISRDRVWLETIIGFTASASIFAMAMRRISPSLRPVAKYTLESGRKLRADIAQVARVLTPVIQARQKHPTGSGAEKKGSSSGNTDDHPQDLVQWLIEASKGADTHPDAIIVKALFLIVAAIHTSALTAIHALYDLCAYPEFMEELRVEAVEEIGANGWSSTSLLRLRKMESFLKESGRVNSGAVVSFQRLTLAPIRLSNGFCIPAGTHICVAADARSRDPKLYEEPTEFRPLRFYAPPKDADVGVDTANLFSSVAAGDSWFGVGRQACPGRWYASAQIKLVLCILLIDYDFMFPEGQGRPQNWIEDERIGPNMEQMILFKRRAATA
ncbi:cytochrome P450 [Annulohypoxylon maeteangense]|uniref:cytochrome P450 n=1 Tax=Annulohypoxylon maeteangense TaxID=1927788 RepID=UPI00200776E8|nr:cytochrome P450 [Annulohypoxylon maeteangense]KAI0888103.1 cytochrome P450 [Annulohypoxylon maeteangense]